MTLAPGRSLSHYRLLAPIGEGGMGVVWQATDSSLGRDVAIKVLPDSYAADPERLARFEREARLLASLNHPHVASIYGFHSAEGVRFLAMELVEGEDLAQRLDRGPVPVVEALPLALQVAQALEHAHEKGVIHRDLKPANIKLTAGGQAKVLDFGLAKALEGDPSRPASSASQSYSPTITGHMTGANVLLGTAAYMAPEQARGQLADRRADIWAFGVVLTEMLTGRRLFHGETISDTLASVLKSDPDWSALPAETPLRVRTLLRRCLERDPKRRLRDIGEARILLESVLAGEPDEMAPGTSAGPASPSRRGIPWPAAAAGGLALGALVMLAVMRGATPDAPARAVTKFQLAVPPGSQEPAHHPAIAPDGRTVAYLQGERLWIQSLGELAPRPLPVEPDAKLLFWSPDGRELGYIAGTRIFKTVLGGVENQLVCDTRGELSTGGWGATWREDGTIVYSRGDSAGLMVVSAVGGDPRPLVPVDSLESDFHEPSALPGDRGLLFASHLKKGGIDRIVLWSGGTRRTLIELPGQTLSRPTYSSSGHIVFRRSPTTPGLWAVPFSLEKLEVTGEPFLVAADGASPSVSREGTLAYVGSPAVGAQTELVWMDRQGREIGVAVAAEPDAMPFPALAPDGHRIARAVTVGGNRDVYIYDTRRGTRTRLTFEATSDEFPTWDPTGTRIAYHLFTSSTDPLSFKVIERAADGTGQVDTLMRRAVIPNYRPDGRALSYVTFDDGVTRWDLAERPLHGPGEARPLVIGNSRVMEGRVSPRGDVMAYMSQETKSWEIFLTRFPSCEGKWQVSTGGGQWPRWDARGDRLFFVQGDDVMEVTVGGGGAPVLGTPRRLFTRPAVGPWNFGLSAGFEVSSDGERVLVARAANRDDAPLGVTVVQNWAAEFAAAAAAARR